MKSDKKLIDDYWKNNFSNESIIGKSDDIQINIARTKGGKKVNENNWERTIHYIIENLAINKASDVLELCCGNGAVLGYVSNYCKSALGVDYSEKLLTQLRHHFKLNNLSVVVDNVLDYDIKMDAFDAIIIYFSIQHFDEREAFLLIEKCIKGLNKNGRILVGDIPDLDKKWSYVDKPEYHQDYFNRVVNSSPKIGYWFQKDFFLAMNSCFPGTTFHILEQPNYQINSDHCFDVLIHKK